MQKKQIKVAMIAMPFEGGTSGIGVYINKLIKYLSRSKRIQLTVFGFENDRLLLGVSESVCFVSVHERYENLSANLFWHSFILPIYMAKGDYDILFLPAANRRVCLLPKFVNTKVVATVHDLAQFHLPQKYDKLRTLYVTKVLPEAWRRFDKIISVSHSTASDLKNITEVKPANIAVVWNGVEHSAYKKRAKNQARESVPKKYNLPEKFILYVARIEHPGKNHLNLVRAYAQLKNSEQKFKHHLVFCGSDWSQAEIVRREVGRLGLSEYIHFTGFIPENVLPYVFSSSDLFVFPSLFEGFGIPAIEAMSAGLPIIAADKSSLPEIIAEAGLFFDPADPYDIAKKLWQGLSDKKFREHSSRVGLLRAKKFSWKLASEETIDVFFKVLG